MKLTQADLEAECFRLGRKLKSAMPPGVGFVFAMFDFGAEGSLAYLSNSRRDDCIRLLRELVAYLETRTN